jgi:hypothetical protein
MELKKRVFEDFDWVRTVFSRNGDEPSGSIIRGNFLNG